MKIFKDENGEEWIVAEGVDLENLAASVSRLGTLALITKKPKPPEKSEMEKWIGDQKLWDGRCKEPYECGLNDGCRKMLEVAEECLKRAGCVGCTIVTDVLREFVNGKKQ
jgi:hypothetical protein